MYAYVGNSPVGALDPFGMWTATVAGGWGVGGVVTIGYNSGQWSVGAYAGVGAGGSLSYDPTNSGPQTPGFQGGLSGTADVGAGSVHVGVDSTVNIPSLTGNANVTIPVGNGAGVTIPLPGSADSGSAHGTWGAGAGGAGGPGEADRCRDESANRAKQNGL